MDQDYIILKKPAQRPAGARGLESVRGDASVPKLSVEQLSAQEAAKLTGDPEIEQIAPAMPTLLISPFDGSPGDSDPEWGLAATGADTSPHSGAGVTVAVLDTGIDAGHPAFAGIEVVEEDFSGDGNGDRQGHGTHCAGTIVGRGTAPRIGIAPGVPRILIGKVLRDNGSGNSEMIFRGLQWAAEKGANIVSMSLGFDFPGTVARRVAQGFPADLATSGALEAYRSNLRMFDRIMALLRARADFGGAPLVVAAAGNASRRRENPTWRIAAGLPAAADGVISVAAVGRGSTHLEIAPFSNSNAMICAPGVDIWSAAPGGGYRSLSGTSMACPHAAGLAALWWEAVRKAGTRPTPTSVQARLLGSARHDQLGPNPAEIDFGQGLVTAPQT